MDFSATIDLIIKDLKEASDIIDDLKKYPGVPALQVELAKSKCKSAGEVIALLKTLKDNSHIAEKESVPPKTEPVMVVKESELRMVQEKEQESSILADQFSHLSSTFNEQMGTMKNEDDIAAILKTKPLTSLLEAIGVNDKFLFIREIFNGNQTDYTQAISRLENAENLTDARAVIMSYTGDNNESTAVKQLLDLVKRKLPSNE
jgi:hypothetical protein